MQRRVLVSALASTAAAAILAPALAAEKSSTAARAPRKKRPGLMGTPKFEQLSFDGKRLVEYTQPFLKKLPKPARRLVAQWMLTYDELKPADRPRLKRLLVYIEYMSEAELHGYLGVETGGGAQRKTLQVRLLALADEPRIPYHTGPKLVVTSIGPVAQAGRTGAVPDAHVMPHVAKDLAAAGTWYGRVTGAAATLPDWTAQVLRGGRADAATPIAAALYQAGTPRLAAWSVLGQGTGAATHANDATQPYLLTTDDALEVDEYLAEKGLRKRMKQAKTAEAKQALRQEMVAMRDQAVNGLHVKERFPDEEAVDFLGQVMFRERGIKDRGNTFVHVGGLRAMQLVHPTFLYIQFGGPDEFLRAERGGQAFGEQGAVGQGNYTDADYLSDMDQWSYYHWLEAQQHPHYAGEASFLLLFGPGRNGATQALLTGPGITPGARVTTPTPLSDLLGPAVSRLT